MILRNSHWLRRAFWGSPLSYHVVVWILNSLGSLVTYNQLLQNHLGFVLTLKKMTIFMPFDVCVTPVSYVATWNFNWVQPHGDYFPSACILAHSAILTQLQATFKLMVWLLALHCKRILFHYQLNLYNSHVGRQYFIDDVRFIICRSERGFFFANIRCSLPIYIYPRSSNTTQCEGAHWSVALHH